MSGVKPEKNALFVADEEETNSDTASPANFHEAYEHQPSVTYEDEDSDEEDENDNEDHDPIIKSIPLILNNLPNRNRQSLHVMQYLNRPKARPFSHDVLNASVKKESNYIEVKVPLNTDKFYDHSKQQEWGTKVEDHGLQGVLNKSEGGLYVAKVVKHQGDTKIVLLPVDSTTQLRPSFKYLDDLDTAASAQRRSEAASDSKPTSVQILQTSAKANPNVNSEGVAHNALGEALKHIRKFDEEEWSSLNWRSTDDSSTQELKKLLLEDIDHQVLSTNTTMDQYIDELTKE